MNLVTQGTLPAAVVSKLTEVMEKRTESYIEERIKQAKATKEAVGEFRKHLSALATALASSKGPCVFIIDELDRCKRTFALNLLERIKHLFSVRGMCFVLVAHLPQLARMVEKEYMVAARDGNIWRSFMTCVLPCRYRIWSTETNNT